MKANVHEVQSDLIFKTKEIITHNKQKSTLIKIAGLLPSDKENRAKDIEALKKLIEGKEVEIVRILFAENKKLLAFINYNNSPIQSYFPERQIPDLEPSRFTDPEEKKPIKKVVSGTISNWTNPLRYYSKVDELPYFDNIKYPVKPWEPDYEKRKNIADALFSKTHTNGNEVNRWFDSFLNDPQREVPLILAGEVGIGKSWYISERLMELPRSKYHTIVIDLRYTMRAEELSVAIIDEVLEQLNYYIKGIRWLIPDFKSIYGDSFDENDPVIQKQMRETAINLLNTAPSLKILKKKLRYYSLPDTERLIVAFDNIDHFSDTELLTILDTCRRIIGYVDGIKTILLIRPSTILPKARTGVSLGDSSVHHITLKSPNVYDVLKRRLSVNAQGESLDINRCIPTTKMTYASLLNIYRKSDTVFGMARLLKELCYTDSLPIPNEKDQADERQQYYSDSIDIRHYLKLFRTLIRSNNLSDFGNIGKVYFGLHALLLKSKEPMSESKSYLFNLFDNELPDLKGNALIRYRVLEYCSKFHDLTDGLFDLFFNGLGYGAPLARKLVAMFAEAGLIKISTVESHGGNIVPIRAELTTAGARHMEIVTNLWYIICIKTGMNIYSDCILYNHEAIERAKLFVSNKKILDELSKRGWVPEMRFIRFLALQEALEYHRADNFCNTHEDQKESLTNLVSQLDSPAANIHYSYHQQIKYWNSVGDTSI